MQRRNKTMKIQQRETRERWIEEAEEQGKCKDRDKEKEKAKEKGQEQVRSSEFI